MLYNQPVTVPTHLLKRVKQNSPIRLAIVCAHHMNVIETVKEAVARCLCRPVLLGDATEIQKLAKENQLSLESIPVIDCGKDDQKAAIKAVDMARNNEVDSIMKGHVHTDVLMRAVVSSQGGLRTDKRVSHVFVMSFPSSERLLMITDAAVNIQPDEKCYRHIIDNVICLAHKMGYQLPKVALLSASEDVLDAMPSSVLAAKTEEWAMENYKNIALVEGPFALDNAISEASANLKGIQKTVAGNADILVVPDIVSGNVLFKSLVYFCGACASGLVLGAKVPIVLTSRADPIEAKITSIALASIQLSVS